eukprot:392879-Pyramimonas_sp.AAC.1
MQSWGRLGANLEVSWRGCEKMGEGKGVVEIASWEGVGATRTDRSDCDGDDGEGGKLTFPEVRSPNVFGELARAATQT